MKHTSKFTIATATLLLLTTHTIHAETELETTTVQQTTQETTSVEQTTQEVEPTTETTRAPRRQKREVTTEELKGGEESTYTGLVYENGETFYHVDGKALISKWKWINGDYYYFTATGKMQKGGLTPDGYVLNEDGKLASPGWVKVKDKWYYAVDGGKAVRNAWKAVNGKWYMFHEDGTMYSNEFNWNYYHKANGEMADDEWVFNNYYNSWFYIKPGGNYARNEWKGAYYLKSGGYMAKSEFIYDANYKATYYLDETGRYVGDKWKEINGKWYYFRLAGEMETNKWIGSYYVKEDGTMATSILLYDETYKSSFYFDENGKYLNKTWKEIDGEWYYFKDGGYMAKNEWVGSYFVKGNGRMAKNEMQYDQSTGSSYYFLEDGKTAKNQWKKVGGYWYYFKSNGKVARNEWIENKYYVLDNGKMATGTHIIDHYQYVFDGSGNILSKKAVDIGWVEKDGKRYFYNGAAQRLGDETTKKVMDVSEHQGLIKNWEGIIKDNGIDAVIVRIGYSGAEDKYLANNISELNRLGIPYGIYLYTYASTEKDGVADAEQTIELIKKYNIKPTYPIYFDLEDWRYTNGAKSAPTDTATWVKIWTAYRDTMAKAGYTNVRVYSYQYLLQNRLNDPEILKAVDWVAAYTPQLMYQIPYPQTSWGWQYTDKEFVVGLGNVDMSVWFGR